MPYIPNAYFVYIKDNGTYFWHLKLAMVPNQRGGRTIVSGHKRRKSLVKLIKDIEKFKRKYTIGFLCNCYTLSYEDYIDRPIDLEAVPSPYRGAK